MKFQVDIQKIRGSTTFRFSMFTYLAIAINGLSGVILARSIGATQRGVLAYYANFLLLTSFLSASNISNATARTLAKTEGRIDKNSINPQTQIIYLGFFMALISAFIVSVLLIHDWELNQHFFVFLMLANGLGAFTSLYDGYWRFSNSIVFLTWTRFVGLAAPSILTLCLIAIGRTEIQFLLLGQLLVTFLNLQIILRFKQTNPASQFPDSNVILKSATRGFPTYLAEYLVTWTVPYLILRVEGSEVLGWYVVALSYALLADVTYGAIEAKNYKRMISNSMDGRIPKFWIFLRNSLPILGMHLFFLPLVVLIPIIYGQDFKNSSLFAIVILVVRVPMVIARAITSYLVSISRNLETFLIFVSFLITYIPVMLLSNFDLFSFHWIFAYSVAGTTMLGCAFLFLAKIKAIEIDK